ncbi:MAG TPA: hypothetical protein VHV49_14570 [Pseudonocardiaceae bacterium]|nr:hypothetical protein [Pseudonocardiaceae bacterium]
MDPRERADMALARARARGAFVVTPDDAVSPMDAANTLQIPRSVVAAADQPDSTMVIPAATVRGQMAPQQYPRPGHQTGPHQPVPAPAYEEEPPAPRQLDGLVPTTQQPGTQRSMLSRRLDGN